MEKIKKCRKKAEFAVFEAGYEQMHTRRFWIFYYQSKALVKNYILASYQYSPPLDIALARTISLVTSLLLKNRPMLKALYSEPGGVEKP